VTRVLRDLGAHVIDADKIVHDLLSNGQDVHREVAEHFGKDILLPDGTVNRRKLGEIVFNDPVQRTWLNQCIHPRVFEAYNHQVRHISERRPDAIVVLDAALLIETGYHKRMDVIIVVSADEEQQVRRLMERDRSTASRPWRASGARCRWPRSGRPPITSSRTRERGRRRSAGRARSLRSSSLRQHSGSNPPHLP